MKNRPMIPRKRTTVAGRKMCHALVSTVVPSIEIAPAMAAC